MRRLWVCAVFGGVALGSALIPTPYWILAPGNAVDLRSHVRVEGYAASPDRFFLTDVRVFHASLLSSLARYLPSMKLVPEDELTPKGVEPAVYERLLMQEMDESQDVAAFVAEQAAGLRVTRPSVHVYVADILPNSQANGVLRTGDMLLAVAGRRIDVSADVATGVRRLAPGSPAPITFERAGRTQHVQVRTVAAPPGSGSRLGILVRSHSERSGLPVPVRYSLEDISGSSGGLMLALQIYTTLHPEREGAGLAAAGTGTLTYDGAVGRIEGVEQKIIAAKRAGLRIFFVPRQNYREASTRSGGIRIVPVGSFREALQALRKD